MDFQEKINQLRGEIIKTLSPLINGDYYHLDNPYYSNIGDVLIWQGENDFLSTLPYKCLRSSSMAWQGNYLRPATILLLQGGGNFGDLWRVSQLFRLHVIQSYPNNRIVMFPQSIWYDDESLISQDAALMAKHKDLHLCARDRWSYDFLCRHFSANHIYLVPDMAFCINDARLQPYRNVAQSGKKLFFRRTDKEIDSSTPETIDANAEIHDWPTVERPLKRFYLMNMALGATRRIHRVSSWMADILMQGIDMIAQRAVRESLVRRGLEFLAPYERVTATRLHALILSVLLHKPVNYIDNKTGKLSAYANTWLNNLDDVKPFQLDEIK